MAGELDPNQITQQMLNPQSQQQDPNDPVAMLTALLSTLGSVLGPSSAEAAQPDPATMAFKMLQQHNRESQQASQQQLQQQRMQQQQQQFDTRRQDTQAAAAAKAKPAPRSIADILAGKQSVGGAAPSGGGSTVAFLPGGNFVSSSSGDSTPWQPAEDFNYNPYAVGPMNKVIPDAHPTDLMFRGKTPGTGTPYFGNVAPDWAPEEVKQQFNTRKAEIDAANKPKQAQKQAGGNEIDPARVQLMAQVAENLKSVPEASRNSVLRMLFPEMEKFEQDKLKNKRNLTLEGQKTMADYNARLRQEAENNKPLAPELQKQLGFAEEMQRQVDSLAQFVDRDEHAPYVGLGADTKYDLARRVGAVDPGEVSLRRSLAELKNVQLYMRSGVAINESEAQRLVNELPDSTDAGDVFKQKFQDFQKELAKQAASKKKFGTMTRGEARSETGAAPVTSGGAAPAAGTPAAASQAQAPAAASLSNLPKGRVPMINPQGKAVALKAEDVQRALQSGYKPYQQ